MGLKAIKYLHLDDTKGSLYAPGGRVLIIPVSFVDLIEKRFIEFFGGEAAAVLIYHLGENFGESYAETLLGILEREKIMLDKVMIIREVFAAVSMESGWGKIEIKELDLEKEKIVVKIIYSPSIQLVKNPQYTFERGILAGAYKRIVGKEIHFQIMGENTEEQSVTLTSLKEIPEEILFSEKMALLPRRELEETKIELEKKITELNKTQAILYSLSEDIQKEKESVEVKVKERTKELSEEHGKIQSLIESVKLGVILVDLNYDIILANSTAKTILGKFPGEPLTFEYLNEKFKQVNLRRLLSDYVEGKGQTQALETMLEERYFRLFLAPVREITEKTFIGAAIILEDITEQKIIEKMRSDIVAITSHQLRTPLSVIKGNLEMLLSGDLGEIIKEQKEVLEEAFLGNERLIKLVNALMDVSKITEGKLELELVPTRLEDLIAESVKELAPFAKKNRVSLSYNPPATPLPVVNVDPGRTKQILQNLIDNAIKYSQADSKGKVSLSVQEDKEEKLLKVSVRDNGVGIPKQEQSKIFEQFFRASNVTQLDPGGGTGLGLYICEAIVEQLGGNLWFESEGEGKGTTFYFTLPI